MQLSKRETEVLSGVVEEYIHSAKPVGSKTLAAKSRLNLSPASIRNTMARLSGAGYLAQPHTSAGRIPTTLGFRCYLDTVLQLRPLSETLREMIRAYIGGAEQGVDEALRRAGKLLSSLSHQVSMVLTPDSEDAKIKSIEFVSVSDEQVLSILVLHGGVIQQRLVSVDKPYTADELTKYRNYLNSLFENRSLWEVRAIIARELKEAEVRLNRLCNRALGLALQSVVPAGDRELIVDGASRMLEQPEFSDASSMRELMGLLEERTRLLELLDKTLRAEGIKVTLGSEADIDDLLEMGLVSTAYGGKSSSRGVIGIIGPVRMNYAKVVPVVDFTARILTKLLESRL